MSMSSHMKFRKFLTWNIYELDQVLGSVYLGFVVLFLYSYVVDDITERCHYSFFAVFNVLLNTLQSSMLPDSLPLSFLDTYSLSMSSLRFKALYHLINFQVLSSNSLSYSFVHFKNGLEYSTKTLSCVFLQCLVSRDFLCLLMYSLIIFSFISVCLMLSSSNILKYCNFPFL